RAIAKTDGAELTAIVARSADSRTVAQAAHPAVQIHSDYREMLARTDIDAVDVVLPSDLHHSIGLAVLESGKHLLIEKPMALTAAECDDVIARARAKGKVLGVGHEMRLASLWGKVKELIDTGAVGTPLYLLVELWRRPYRQGAGGWRYDRKRVGNWVLE